MKKKKRFKRDIYKDDDPTDEDFPVGKLTEVPNFLPPPSELAKAPTLVRITIALDKSSLDFFQKQAAKYKTKYQRMIRSVLSHYVSSYVSEYKAA